MRIPFLAAAAALLLLSILSVAGDTPRSNSTTTPVVQRDEHTDAMRLEGEKRFRANCARCHAAPQKFPPRMMATIVRHMRVRATITDEDMRLVLYYMTR
jgi:hypothetical protein